MVHRHRSRRLSSSSSSDGDSTPPPSYSEDEEEARHVRPRTRPHQHSNSHRSRKDDEKTWKPLIVQRSEGKNGRRHRREEDKHRRSSSDSSSSGSDSDSSSSSNSESSKSSRSSSSSSSSRSSSGRRGRERKDREQKRKQRQGPGNSTLICVICVCVIGGLFLIFGAFYMYRKSGGLTSNSGSNSPSSASGLGGSSTSAGASNSGSKSGSGGTPTSSGSQPSGSKGTNSTSGSGTRTIGAYWPAYSNGSPSDVNFGDDGYGIAYYFNVVVGSDGSLTWGGGDPAAFVKAAQAKKAKASFSLGGAGGGDPDQTKDFQTLAGSTSATATFVKNVEAAVKKYGFDGLDLDWEYPANQNELDQFLAIIKTFRKDLGKDFIISAASSMDPWGSSTDLSGFADQLSYINLMTYDSFGSWTDVSGPNIALSGSCGPKDMKYDIPTAIGEKLGSCKVPRQAGLPAYAHIFEVDTFKDGGGGGATSGVYQTSNAAGSKDGKNYVELVKAGYLNGTDGFKDTFDNCSSTPYLYSSSKKQLIPYDNAKSIGLKAAYAKQNGMAGCFFFDSAGDSNGELLKAMRDACG
ncbi:glycoside hydrolase [Meredithblackwellia eburnea MCA 4105]